MTKYTVIMFVFIAIMASCKKDDFVASGPNRLFRPTLKGDMVSNGNWIETSWQKVKGADSYTVEISKDTFKTIIQSLTVDTNFVHFGNLRWNQLYQIQVRAKASDTTMNSKFSYLGEMKSAKFPTIITPLSSNDIIDAGLKLQWTNSGSAVTSIKVLNAADSSLVKEIPLSDLDRTRQYRVISGLTAKSDYIVYLYSNTTVRGWEDVKTKASQVFAPGSNIIDLRGNEDPTILTQTLTSSLPSGSVILLDRGMTYNMSSYNLSGALTLVSGLGYGPVATIRFTGNFNFVAGSTIDSLSFIDLNMFSTDYTGKYVLNGSSDATVGKITFERCKARIFRGLVRVQNKIINVQNFSIHDCVLDSIGNYGVVNVDGAAAKIENISIKNSTIFKTEKIISSKNNSTSVLIENCTINEAPLAGNFLVDYYNSGPKTPMDIFNGLTISNTILGVGKSKDGDARVRGARIGSNTTINISGVYATSDYVTVDTPLPPLSSYSGTSTQLFADPENGDFTIRDLGFSGKATAGDPRWRP